MKALIVGGSNGVGAGIVDNLLNNNCELVYIYDKYKPIIDDKRVVWIKSNLINQEFDNLLAIKNEINYLFITAGVGRLCSFENIEYKEIEWMFKINALSPIKILKLFYDKIASVNNFYVGVMSSIAGRVSSPLYALYAATKASVSRFVESANIELAESGFANRIMECSPGSVRGTCFHGGITDIESLKFISAEIVKNTIARQSLYIPKYDEIYKDVLGRYNVNAEKFGHESYKYKLENAKLENVPKMKIGYLSGTFDMFHIGHLNLLRRAKQYCDYLIVGVHKDASHKGKSVIISFDDRCEILRSCKYVDEVVESQKEDSDAYDIYHYDMLFVGSDYKGSERFNAYEKYFEDKNVKIIYFDYTQGISSTELREKIKEKENAKDN
ncbi:MAG: SDR family NAD(P)-dependent oxidoreductase [Clostridia bacterium]